MKVITIEVGPLSTNCYILLDEKGNAAVIDPGWDGDLILKRLSEEGASISFVLLTHVHFDHINGLSELGDVKVYIHKNDISAITDENKSLATLFNSALPKFNAIPIPVEDGDKIPFGGSEFTVMHTPGHTMGSCVFIIDSLIFSGDTLFAGNIGRTDLYGGNEADMRCSLKKLYTLEDDYKILSGHGVSSTLLKEKRENRYLSSCSEV